MNDSIVGETNAWSAELYKELHARARHQMARQPHGHTLQPTALVNEAYMKLHKVLAQAGHSKEDFMKLAATTMRNILIDHARKKGREKRDGGLRIETPLDSLASEMKQDIDLEALNEALLELEGFDPEMARAVELKFFAGVPMTEIAPILQLTLRTCERRWKLTKAWLNAKLNG